MTADYSQIEMRIMAHLSEDAGLIEAFTTGEDLHTFVASRAFDCPPEAVDAELRRRVKAMSYGLAYGLSAFGLAAAAQDQLRRGARRRWTPTSPGSAAYATTCARWSSRPAQDGYTETILGRRRYLPDLTSDNRQRREMAERMALNAPIQGSAADIIKVAMLGVAPGPADAAACARRLLLQVHDELVLEVAPGEREPSRRWSATEMGGAYPLARPARRLGRRRHDLGRRRPLTGRDAVGALALPAARWPALPAHGDGSGSPSPAPSRPSRWSPR